MADIDFKNYLGLRLAYNGLGYSGSQWQPSKKSIQQEIERLSKSIFKYKGRVHFLSRTDAGVHAWDQIVLIPDASACLDPVPRGKQKALLPTLNSMLPESIRVWKWGLVRAPFDFKADVQSKTYSYFIFNSPVWDPSLGPCYFWRRKPLSVSILREQLRALLGENDFSAFAKSSGALHKDRSRKCVRRLISAEVSRRQHPRIESANTIEIRLKGDGFLQHMVRNIVGSLVDYSDGKLDPLYKVLKSKSRKQAGRAAPAEALFLRHTQLSRGVWRPYKL